MAKFRDSTSLEGSLSSVLPPAAAASAATEAGAAPIFRAPGQRSSTAEDAATPVHDRSIGDIISELRDLTAEQVESVLAYQRQNGVRFGEAAVALGMATNDDVMFALARQFHYPYAPEGQRNLSPELVVLNQPFCVQSEAFRAMRSQLMARLFGDNQSRRSLAVISPESGDGKTYFASNLAIALAQLGGRTLLVDADLRGPRVHEVFRISNRAGLSGLLSGRSDGTVIQQISSVPSLFVLPVGVTPPNPLELVERPAFGLLMRELGAKFDHVVVDTPAFVYGADACVIAARCGSAIAIARKHKSRVEALGEMVATLDGTPANLLGVIMNEF